jgi:hypothetical protein
MGPAFAGEADWLWLVRQVDREADGERQSGGGPSPRGNLPFATVRIIKRRDAIYQLREEYWRRSEYEGEVISESWVPLWEGGFFGTADIAEREARATFDWLRDPSTR